jgi:membrane protease subunit HflK
MKESDYELKEMGALDILKGTLKIYHDNFALFIGVVAILFAPVVLLSGIGQIQFEYFSLLLNFLIVVTGAVAVGGLTVALSKRYLKETVSLGHMLRRIDQPELFSVLGAAFLVASVFTGFELLIIGTMKITTVGVFILVPVAILVLWLMVNWSLFVQCIAIEKRSIRDSLRRSRELVHKNWWRVFGLLFLLLLFLFVPAFLARTFGEGASKLPMLGSLFTVLSIVLTAPLYAIGTTLLYYDLRIRKRDLDKEELAESVGSVKKVARQFVVDKDYERKRNALYIVLCANLFLIALKFTLASISGSLAITASGWMSVENFFLTGAVLLGVLISVRDSRISKKLSIIENVLAIVISIVVLFIAGNMFVKMFIKMAHGMKDMAGHGMPAGGLKHVPAVTLAAIFGAGICYFMSQYKIYIGKSCKSTSIEAAGRHCRMHVFMELAVIIGLIGAWIGLEKLNLLAAAFVLAYVIYTGFTILWRGYRGLTAGYPMEHACHIERNYKLMGSFIAAMLSLYLATGVYTVKWNEIGVVKQFGREIETVQPGIHYHLPWPIESVQKVKMDEVRELKTDPILLVAGDENLVKVRIGVHYGVTEASDYIFNVQAPDKLVLYNIETAIRHIVGRLRIIGEEENQPYLLTNGKAEVEETATQLLQQLLDKDRSGIKVLNVQILALDPPDEVTEAFRDIASAMEEKQTYIHEAEDYRNQIVIEAVGKAEAMVSLAEGYRVRKINNAKGEAEAYLKKLTEYRKARRITDIRLYLETMEKILPGIKKVFVDQSLQKETTDLWLLNDKVKGKVVGLE